MNTIKRYPLVSTALALMFLAVFIAASATPKAEASAANNATPKCNVTTLTPVSIGASNSVQVLATSTKRAYARIQQTRDNAGVSTSTPTLGLNGASATLGGTMQLSTSTPFITAGIDTDFPYVGAISAITNTGSTTIQVIECLYP